MRQMLQDLVQKDYKSLTNQSYLTERVRRGCLRAGLENISKSALVDLSYGLIDLF